jgi:hypothetical protein
MRWEFGDLEFVALWNRADGDFVPHPLTFSSTIPTWEEFATATARLAGRVHRLRDAGADDLIRVLTEPDIQITVLGNDGRDPFDPSGVIRLLCARKGAQGWVVRQLPGETIWDSSGFVATDCEATQLAAAITRELPKSPPGRIPEQPLTTAPRPDESDSAATDHHYGRSSVLRQLEYAGVHTTRDFLTAPLDTMGEIEITQCHSKFGPRGCLTRRIQWRDLHDDGRYVIPPDEPPIAAAADDQHLIARINIEVAAIVQRVRDERA